MCCIHTEEGTTKTDFRKRGCTSTVGFSVECYTQNPVSLFPEIEKVAHLKSSSKGGQNTHINLIYLAHSENENGESTK